MLFVGCLVAAVHGWSAVGTACAMFGVVCGDARPLLSLLLSPCSTGSALGTNGALGCGMCLWDHACVSGSRLLCHSTGGMLVACNAP